MKEQTVGSIPQFVEHNLIQRFDGLSYAKMNQPLPEDFITHTVTRDMGKNVEIYNICGVLTNNCFHLYSISCAKEKNE